VVHFLTNGFRKISDNGSDIQGHSRSLMTAPFDRSRTILLVFYCNSSIFYPFQNIVIYFFKLKGITS